MIIYTDASFHFDKRIAKIAVIVKNDEGETLDCITDHVVCNNSAQAELYAIMESIYYLSDNIYKNHKIKIISDYQPIVFLLNSSSFIKKLLDNKKIFKNMDRERVLEIYIKLQKLKLNNKITLKWTPRKNNKEADKLSKMYKRSDKHVNNI